MAEVQVKFLGEEYTLPSELKEFVAYLQQFEKVRERLMQMLTKDMRGKIWGCNDENEEKYRRVMIEEGRKVVAQLAQHGIYSATTRELVEETRGYQMIRRVCQAGLERYREILTNAVLEWKQGYERAYNSAASQITGSGVSIWTNSLSSALLYTAMESSTLVKQAREADKEYASSIERLNANTNNKMENAKLQVMAKEYYPGIAEAINSFTSELMEKFLNKLAVNGKFDYSKIRKYDLQRSTDLLQNVSMISDKARVLKEAFLCCPYNPDIYQKILECDLAEVETFKTAKYFEQDKILLKPLEEYCMKNLDDMRRIRCVGEILRLFKNTTMGTVLKSLYESHVNDIVRKYDMATRAVIDKGILDKWIRKNIDHSMDVLISKTEDELIATVGKNINSIITMDLYNLLVGNYAIDIDDIRLKNSMATNLDEINNEIIRELCKEVIAYVEEANRRKQEYLKVYAPVKAEMDKRQTKINELKKQVESIGLFGIVKKKKLEKQIGEMQRELYRYEYDNEPRELWEAYKTMYSSR